MRNAKHMITSVCVENSFDIIQQSFNDKTFRELIKWGKVLNIIKALYEKPAVNVLFNHEKLETFPLRSGTWQGFYCYNILFNTVMDVLGEQQGGKRKHFQIVKEGVKWSLSLEKTLKTPPKINKTKVC